MEDPVVVKFLKRFGKNFRSFTIVGPDHLPYLTRYFVFECSRFKVYLHHFHRSDADRDLHTHPWDFTSFILYGGYFEHLIDGIKKRKAPWIVRRKAKERHKVELFKNPDGSEQQTWTLVIVGKKYTEWGFWVDDVWVHHRDYFDKKFGKGNWHDADEFKQSRKMMDDE
jgi:hypothetical protein